MLKLGTETGSLINHLMSRSPSEKPEVGMGVTILCWTDRNPGTITRVYEQGKNLHIEVQEDNYTRVDSNGMSESQTYEFSPNPEGYVQTYRQVGQGWLRVTLNQETNRWSQDKSSRLVVGRREKYHDFSF